MSKFIQWFKDPSHLLAVVAIIISALAYRTSSDVARESLELSRLTSKVELEPDLRILASLSIEPDRSPSIQLINNGPVAAQHVAIHVIAANYDPTKGRVVVKVLDGAPSAYFPSIAPLERETMLLDRSLLIDRVPLVGTVSGESFYNDLLEVRVQYYREVDRKKFVGRRFFFRGPDGAWARENLSSFPHDILEAALDSMPADVKDGDALHPEPARSSE